MKNKTFHHSTILKFNYIKIQPPTHINNNDFIIQITINSKKKIIKSTSQTVTSSGFVISCFGWASTVPATGAS